MKTMDITRKKENNSDNSACKVERSEVLGRYLVAARDIKAGEVVIQETPLVVGPRGDSLPMCLACYRPLPLQGPRPRCSKCRIVPLCSTQCETSGDHTATECDALQTLKTSSHLMDDSQVLLPLRCLLLRRSADPQDRARWQHLLSLETHLETRRHTAVWWSHQAHVDKPLKDIGAVQPEDDPELIQRVCGVLDVNSFEVRAPGLPSHAEHLRLRAVYLQAALMAHHCIANSHLAVDDNFIITVHASVHISQGQPIFFNYTSPLQGTSERREHLHEGKYFDCTCSRCRDPTELGTYMSSLKCVKCRGKGLVSPVEALKENSPWECNQCGHYYSALVVHSATARGKDLLEDIDKSNSKDMEDLLFRLQRSFAPHHSLILELKQNLIAVYRNTNQPNNKILAKTINLCLDIIPILRRLEPGISRLLGISLYELHTATSAIANKQFQNGKTKEPELLQMLQESEGYLREAVAHLIYEPQNTHEGQLAKMALQDLRALRLNIQNLVLLQEDNNTNKKHKPRGKKISCKK